MDAVHCAYLQACISLCAVCSSKVERVKDTLTGRKMLSGQAVEIAESIASADMTGGTTLVPQQTFRQLPIEVMSEKHLVRLRQGGCMKQATIVLLACMLTDVCMSVPACSFATGVNTNSTRSSCRLMSTWHCQRASSVVWARLSLYGPAWMVRPRMVCSNTDAQPLWQTLCARMHGVCVCTANNVLLHALAGRAMAPGVLSAPMDKAAMVFTHIVGVQTLLSWNYELASSITEIFTRLAGHLLRLHSGYLVEHVSGFMLSAFQDPGAAIQWATHLQQMMMEEPW